MRGYKMAREPEKLPSEREALQEQITRDREEFLKNGGKITYVEPATFVFKQSSYKTISSKDKK
jgi:hypothetical protein